MKEKFKSFVDKHKEIWKFIKFAFTGASTSILQLLVDLFCLYVVFASMKDQAVENEFLVWLGVGDQMAAAYSYFISAVVGYAAAFIMNRKMTFKADSNPVLSMILYVLMVVFTILVTTWMKPFLRGLIVNAGYENAFIDIVLDIVVMTVPTVWTYPLQRFVIHRKKKTPENAAADTEEKAEK
ncbi:MAG: GtrA family protein [Clostridiales bacterium]|nr:GtrA family protein [Clostridiales bacterium]